MKELEGARQKKEIGKGLEADVKIKAVPSLYRLLKKHEDGLKELFNVSNVAIDEFQTEPLPTANFNVSQDINDGFSIYVGPASGHKCARCWNFMPEVSAYGIWQNVCTRCQSALREMGIDPPQPPEPAQ
jgi:isoleucyl-tRNA synthetase